MREGAGRIHSNCRFCTEGRGRCLTPGTLCCDSASAAERELPGERSTKLAQAGSSGCSNGLESGADAAQVALALGVHLCR